MENLTGQYALNDRNAKFLSLMRNFYEKSRVIHYIISKKNNIVTNMNSFDKNILKVKPETPMVEILKNVTDLTQKTFLDSTWGVKIPRINANFLDKLSNTCKNNPDISNLFELNEDENNKQKKNNNTLNVSNLKSKKVRFFILGSNKFCMDQSAKKIYNFINENREELKNKTIEIYALASTHTNKEDNSSEDECAGEVVANLNNKLKELKLNNDNIKFIIGSYVSKKLGNKYINTVEVITELLSVFNRNDNITFKDKDYKLLKISDSGDYVFDVNEFVEYNNIFIGNEPELTRQKADIMFSNLRVSALEPYIDFYGVDIDEYINNTLDYIKDNYSGVNGEQLKIANNSSSNAYNKIKKEYEKFRNLLRSRDKNIEEKTIDDNFKKLVKIMLQLNSVSKAMYSCCKKIKDIKQSIWKDNDNKDKSTNKTIYSLCDILSNIVNDKKNVENKQKNTDNGEVNDVKVKTVNKIRIRDIKHNYKKAYGNSRGKTEENVMKIIKILKKNIKISKNIKDITINIKTHLCSKDEITIQEEKDKSLNIKVGRDGYFDSENKRITDIKKAIEESFKFEKLKAHTQTSATPNIL